MAAEDEKSASATENTPESPSSKGEYAENPSIEEAGTPAPLEGAAWMYKPIKLGPLTLPWFASPPSQLTFVALVCFLCPGMYNAVNGLGAGGTISTHDIDNATVATYSTFAGVGFFAGSIANRIGLKLTLSIGGFGYFLYVASILSYVHNGNVGFLIFAGALLGLCAALLWTAQGAIMMSYPAEEHKGKYISWFWMIFNLGAVIGSLVPLGENMHKEAGNVTDGTYIAFLVLMASGFVLAWGLIDSRKIRRADGSHVVVMKNPTWKTEILGLFEVLRTDSYIILLFPMFFASNWFYAYHFNGYNFAKFNVRTRALNNTLYYLCQIFGAYIFGYALDVKSVSRPLKAKILVGVLFTLTMVIWGGGYAVQKGYTRASTDPKKGFKGMDFEDSGYVGLMFLYMFYGFYDSVWQTSAYWLMGSLTNNGRKLANFAGFYKGIQSAGAAVMWRLDALKIPYMSEFASCWGLLAGALLIAAPVLFTKVRDTVPLEDDLAFSDETVREVAATAIVEKVEREGLAVGEAEREVKKL